jgi:hypothetical protein
MNWLVKEACRVSDAVHGESRVWFVDLLGPALREVTLGICMLDRGLIAQLQLSDPQFRHSLRICRAPSAADPASRLEEDAASLRVTLSQRALEAYAQFCLEAVRDGFAPVDHFDIELQTVEPAKGQRGLVIAFPTTGW